LALGGPHLMPISCLPGALPACAHMHRPRAGMYN
jgi:hypothetical protein